MLSVKSLAAQSANDSVNWSQLGADATALGSSFNVTSDAGLSVAATLSGSGSLVSVACPASPCSWNGTGFNADDSLVWTSGPGKGGNGPLNLNMGSPVSGIGAFIEADGPSQFTAQIQVFNGATSLGSFPVTSNTNGDATYVGVIDQTGANISSAIFSITSCNGVCSDFAIDTVKLNRAAVASPTPTATGSPGATPTATPTPTPTASPTPAGRLRVKQKSVRLFAKVNHHASANVKVSNHGKGMLEGSVNGPVGSPFSSIGTGPFTFSPGGAKSIKVTFSPIIKGKFKAVLTITSDDPSHPSVQVPITGTATGTAGTNVASPVSGTDSDSAADPPALTDATIASPQHATEVAAADAPTGSNADASAATPSGGAGWYIPVIPPFGGPTFNIGPWASLADCNDMDGSFMYKHPIACHRTGLPADCGIVGNGAGYPKGTPYPPLAENDPTTRIMGGCFFSNVTAARHSGGNWYFLEYHALPTPGGSAQACNNFKSFKAKAKKDPQHYKVATVTHACGGPCWPAGIDNACE